MSAVPADEAPQAPVPRRKPTYTQAQRVAMRERAAIARAALAKYRSEGKVIAPKRKSKPKRAAVFMHSEPTNLPVLARTDNLVRVISGEIPLDGHVLRANGHAPHAVFESDSDLDRLGRLIVAVYRNL